MVCSNRFNQFFAHQINVVPQPYPKLLHIFELFVFNIHGKKINTFSKPKQETLKISTKNYKNGLYFIEICLNNTSKIIKKLIVN